MRIQSIPDLHGKVVWKDLIDLSCDKIIFLGDYVDDYPPTTDEQIVTNFLDVIQVKKDNPDKVELLLGNHDEMYYNNHHNCSGYRPSYAAALNMIFTENKDLFKIAYQIDKHIWTHAGISEGWYKMFLEQVNVLPEGNIAEELNGVFNSSDVDLITCVGYTRGGHTPYGGPLWADKSETFSHYYQALTSYHQIVGHSRVPHIIKREKGNSSITYCDCLDSTQTTLYTIEI